MSEGGILTGPAIRRALELGDIEIDPYNPNHVNSNSVDLTLGTDIFIYNSHPEVLDFREQPDGGYDEAIYGASPQLDFKKRPGGTYFRMRPDGALLIPGVLYLGHTAERVCTTKYVPILDGKSSVGRLGVFVHVTAGYGDTFFNGQWTFEFVVIHPIKIYPGVRIGQMRFHAACGEIEDYTKKGNYVGKMAQGPVPSMFYKQFLK
jgi:dCTP deaminase